MILLLLDNQSVSDQRLSNFEMRANHVHNYQRYNNQDKSHYVNELYPRNNFNLANICRYGVAYWELLQLSL